MVFNGFLYYSITVLLLFTFEFPRALPKFIPYLRVEVVCNIYCICKILYFLDPIL